MPIGEYNERVEAVDMSSHELHESACDLPLCDLESQLLVTEENMLQVFVRLDCGHKLIEDIMWRI